MKTAIVTDSNSGITQAEAQKMNVFVLPMPVIIEGQAYYEGIDLLPDQFFRALTERQAVSTSQPSPGDVTALWDKVLAEYEELVYIPMSSGLSASCATAQMLAEDYEGRVFVVDNHRISISQKSSAWDAVALREAGCGAQEIQRELAELIRSLKDPRVQTMISITRVDTTPDLRYSKIYVSVLDKNQEKDVLKGLKSASGFLRRELGHALQLRYTPELQFIADDSIAYGAHILEVLRDPEKVKPVNPDNDAVLPEEE